MATADYFLKIEGISGEATTDKHKGEINIMSYQWGLEIPATGPQPGGKVSVSDFSFVKRIDKASPELLLHCASGEHITKAVLTMRKAGNPPLEYLTYTFEDVLVSSVRESAHSPNLPTEEFSLNFQKVTFVYKTQQAVITNPGSGGP